MSDKPSRLGGFSLGGNENQTKPINTEIKSETKEGDTKKSLPLEDQKEEHGKNTDNEETKSGTILEENVEEEFIETSQHGLDNQTTPFILPEPDSEGYIWVKARSLTIDERTDVFSKITKNKEKYKQVLKDIEEKYLKHGYEKQKRVTVWIVDGKAIVTDGNSRTKIVAKHDGELTIFPKEYNNIEEAIEDAYEEQYGRRNIDPAVNISVLRNIGYEQMGNNKNEYIGKFLNIGTTQAKKYGKLLKFEKDNPGLGGQIVEDLMEDLISLNDAMEKINKAKDRKKNKNAKPKFHDVTEGLSINSMDSLSDVLDRIKEAGISSVKVDDLKMLID